MFNDSWRFMMVHVGSWFMMVQDVSSCFMMFHDVSRCFPMFPDVSWCVVMFRDVLCFLMFRRCFDHDGSWYFTVFHGASGFLKMFHDDQWCFSVFSHGSAKEFHRSNKNTQDLEDPVTSTKKQLGVSQQKGSWSPHWDPPTSHLERYHL